MLATWLFNQPVLPLLVVPPPIFGISPNDGSWQLLKFNRRTTSWPTTRRCASFTSLGTGSWFHLGWLMVHGGLIHGWFPGGQLVPWFLKWWWWFVDGQLVVSSTMNYPFTMNWPSSFVYIALAKQERNWASTSTFWYQLRIVQCIVCWLLAILHYY